MFLGIGNYCRLAIVLWWGHLHTCSVSFQSFVTFFWWLYSSATPRNYLYQMFSFFVQTYYFISEDTMQNLLAACVFLEQHNTVTQVSKWPSVTGLNCTRTNTNSYAKIHDYVQFLLKYKEADGSNRGQKLQHEDSKHLYIHIKKKKNTKIHLNQLYILYAQQPMRMTFF